MTYTVTDQQDRVISIDSYGRKVMQRVNNRPRTGFIRIHYSSRALEWINIRKLFQDLLIFFQFSHLCSLVENITFAWSYDQTLASVLYKPAAVFKQFSFVHLLHMDQTCACTTTARLRNFCDPLTGNETSSFCKASVHVRTMNINIIQHVQLRSAVCQGLNHIPLRPTSIAKAIASIMMAFEQLVQILHLNLIQFPTEAARLQLHATCLSSLKAASQANKFGFRFSGNFLFDITAVKNETEWLLKHMFCSGLDKAANNACFICIRHIRLQALERLSGDDFRPCRQGSSWDFPSYILDKVVHDLSQILPESLPPFQSLPYLMATFKQHKAKYRWLTNAHNTVFSNIAIFFTITSKVILESVKTWAHAKIINYMDFLQVDTSLYWIVNSIIDTTLNLPTTIQDIFVVDISRCYETIPLSGPDNLIQAITFIVKIAFKEAAKLHPRTHTNIWVRIALDGSPASALWATRKPHYGFWIEFTATRLLSLHQWLMLNCYLTLGDRVWLQCKGIPMGFSCSPIWCNMYLLSYEIKFIQRLAKLGRVDLLAKFKHAFRYIDDLCLLNVQNPRDFLSPNQLRTDDNPFWIYPLNVLEIKEETTSFSQSTPEKGISAHFMNVEFILNEGDPHLFKFRKFDKCRDLPFAYTQYIKFRSNRPVHQAYNIAISQVLPILYISNSEPAAMDEIQALICTFCVNGFKRPRLIKIISNFLQNGSFPDIKVDIQMIINSL
jgi:hypothetical protein